MRELRPSPGRPGARTGSGRPIVVSPGSSSRQVGGNIIDRGVDGSECRWRGSWLTSLRTGSCSVGTSARVGRSKPSRAGRVRSRFGSTPKPLPAAGLELEHRHIVRHGPESQSVTDGDEGWPVYLTRYAAPFTDGS